jgi:hypothetical protein
MRGIAALAACSVLAALPAQAQNAERIAEFLSAVEAAGCVIDETNNQAILQRLSMTEDEGTRIVMVLMSDGRAVPQDDDLRITTGTCN